MLFIKIAIIINRERMNGLKSKAACFNWESVRKTETEKVCPKTKNKMRVAIGCQSWVEIEEKNQGRGGVKKQARKLQDAQAEKLTSLQAEKLKC